MLSLDLHSQISILSYVAVSDPKTFFSVIPRLSSKFSKLIQDHQLTIRKRIQALNNLEKYEYFLQSKILLEDNFQYYNYSDDDDDVNFCCGSDDDDDDDEDFSFRFNLQRHIRSTPTSRTPYLLNMKTMEIFHKVILKWFIEWKPEYVLLAIDSNDGALFLQLMAFAPSEMITPKFWNFVIFKTRLACLNIWKVVLDRSEELTLHQKISIVYRLSTVRKHSPERFASLADSLVSLGFTMFDLPAMNHYLRQKVKADPWAEWIIDRRSARWHDFKESRRIDFEDFEFWKTIFIILRLQYKIPDPPYANPNRIETVVEARFVFNFFSAFLTWAYVSDRCDSGEKVLGIIRDMYSTKKALSRTLAFAVIDQLYDVEVEGLVFKLLSILDVGMECPRDFDLVGELVERVPAYLRNDESFLNDLFEGAYFFGSDNIVVWSIMQSARKDGSVIEQFIRGSNCDYGDYIRYLRKANVDVAIHAFKFLIEQKDSRELSRLIKFCRWIKSAKTFSILRDEFYQLISVFGSDEENFMRLFDDDYFDLEYEFSKSGFPISEKVHIFTWTEDDFAQAVFKEAFFRGYTNLVVFMMRNDASRSKMFPAFLNEMDALARAVKNEDMVKTIERER